MSSRPLSPVGAAKARGADSEDRFGLLISIQPRFANAILEGTKTVELRRKPPRDQPDVVLIYGSGTAGAVLGAAQLEKVHVATPETIWKQFGDVAGVSRAEFDNYFEGSESAAALELTNVRRSDGDVSLTRLREFGLEPPQSWRYVERRTALQLLDALGLAPVESRVRRRRPLSWAPALPIALADVGLLEQTTTLNRPLMRLIDSIRCVGLAGVGAREASILGRHRSAPKPELD